MCPPVVLCNWIYFIPSLFVCTIMHDCCLSAYSFVCFYGYLALCVLSFQHIRCLSVYHSILFLCMETSGAEAARFSENLSKISAVCKLQPLNQCPTVLFFFFFHFWAQPHWGPWLLSACKQQVGAATEPSIGSMIAQANVPALTDYNWAI